MSVIARWRWWLALGVVASLSASGFAAPVDAPEPSPLPGPAAEVAAPSPVEPPRASTADPSATTVVASVVSPVPAAAEETLPESEPPAEPPAESGVMFVPSLELRQGWNDNVNAAPGDPLVPVVRERGGFATVAPSVRLEWSPADWVTLGASLHADWERYLGATSGNAAGRTGQAEIALSGRQGRIALAGGAFSQRYENLVDELGRGWLDHRGGRVSLAVEAPVALAGDVSASAAGALVTRRYPGYAVVTDASRPADRSARLERALTLAAGVVWSAAPFLTLRTGYQAVGNDGNTLVAAAGGWADYHSFHGRGATAGATLRTAGPLTFEVGFAIQRLAYDERPDGAGTGVESVWFRSVTDGISWAVNDSVVLMAEHEFIDYRTTSAATSFADHRFTAGVRVFDRIPLF